MNTDRETVLRCLGSVVVAGVGALGLLHDSWLRQVAEIQVDVHAAFACLLVGTLGAEFFRGLRSGALCAPAAVQACSRQCTRWVYLMLYLAIGVRETIGMAHLAWYGGPYDFDLRLGGQSQQDCRAIIVCGLVALVAVRGLAYATVRWGERHPGPGANLHHARQSELYGGSPQ